jgi:Na+-transporting methylmalonyl-CoA/oxaloacetate decarboxylase gamma subunit
MKKMTKVKIAVVLVFLGIMALVLHNMGAFDPPLREPETWVPVFDTIPE